MYLKEGRWKTHPVRLWLVEGVDDDHETALSPGRGLKATAYIARATTISILLLRTHHLRILVHLVNTLLVVKQLNVENVVEVGLPADVQTLATDSSFATFVKVDKKIRLK